MFSRLEHRQEAQFVAVCRQFEDLLDQEPPYDECCDPDFAARAGCSVESLRESILADQQSLRSLAKHLVPVSVALAIAPHVSASLRSSASTSEWWEPSGRVVRVEEGQWPEHDWRWSLGIGGEPEYARAAFEAMEIAGSHLSDLRQPLLKILPPGVGDVIWHDSIHPAAQWLMTTIATTDGPWHLHVNGLARPLRYSLAWPDFEEVKRCYGVARTLQLESGSLDGVLEPPSVLRPSPMAHPPELAPLPDARWALTYCGRRSVIEQSIRVMEMAGVSISDPIKLSDAAKLMNEHWGIDISERTLLNRINQLELPGVLIGGAWYVSQAYIETHGASMKKKGLPPAHRPRDHRYLWHVEHKVRGRGR